MPVALYTHPVCLEHDPGPFHPERPDRLRAVQRALEHPDFAALLRKQAPEATRAQLALVHPMDYVEAILAIRPEPGERVQLDADTVMSSQSAAAALRAAGGAVAAVDAVVEGGAETAFVATRPPGHHAEPDRPMGFCLFSNAAIAACHARARWGLRRIAVADFDVHHGNGTQAAFERDPDLFYGSSHQYPCYPGTGAASETGIAGNVANAPLPPGAGSREFRRAWEATILPALAAHRPELLIVSAGFDAHRADPLAALMLDAADFAWITDRLLEVACACCGGRLVSLLEGGYDLDALAASAGAHVRRLLRL